MAATSSLDSTRTSDPPPSRQLTRVVATSSPPPTRIRSGESSTARPNGTTLHSCSPVHSWHPLSHTDPDAAGRAVTRSSGASQHVSVVDGPRNGVLARGCQWREAALDEDLGGVNRVGVRADHFHCGFVQPGKVNPQTGPPGGQQPHATGPVARALPEDRQPRDVSCRDSLGVEQVNRLGHPGQQGAGGQFAAIRAVVPGQDRQRTGLLAATPQGGQRVRTAGGGRSGRGNHGNHCEG